MSALRVLGAERTPSTLSTPRTVPMSSGAIACIRAIVESRMDRSGTSEDVHVLACAECPRVSSITARELEGLPDG